LQQPKLLFSKEINFYQENYVAIYQQIEALKALASTGKSSNQLIFNEFSKLAQNPLYRRSLITGYRSKA